MSRLKMYRVIQESGDLAQENFTKLVNEYAAKGYRVIPGTFHVGKNKYQGPELTVMMEMKEEEKKEEKEEEKI